MQLEPPEASVYLPRKPLHVGFSSIRELLSSRLAKESGRSPKELSKNISLRSLQPVGDHLPVMRPGEHLLLGQVRSGEAPGVVEAFKQELERSFSTAAFRVVEEV
ncbi:MAG TPA: hypothetical protein PKD64_19425, partial [Pirellulaceae bacterium]|nr:hypothetical protein [Pirellulaceae bacterium]